MHLLRTLRALALLAFLSASLPRQASAQIFCEPSPSQSSTPTIIRLVGQNGAGVTDPIGTFTIVVRDLAASPMANVSVVVELAAPDVVFCASQDANFAVLSGMRVQAFTDAAGRVTGRIRGAGSGPAVQTTGNSGFRVFACGSLIGTGKLTAFDLDGGGGINAGDLSVLLEDFVTDPHHARCDYDNNGSISGNDLSMFLTVFSTASSAVGCGP